MQSKIVRPVSFVVAVLITIGLCLIDADAQTRRKRRSRRAARPVITNPVITPATADQNAVDGGEKIISTADEAANADEGQATDDKTTRSLSKSGEEDMQKTINTLSNQVNKLTDKLSQMQENDRTLLEMERLTRAEQRAESLRQQQLDVETKLADVQSRLEQTEYWLKPENIERATATFGSTRPEEAREARRRQLEGERSRFLAQIKILENSRTRLEVAVANADAEVELLRRRLDQKSAQEESATTKPEESRPQNVRRKPE
ncbi:MAG: hypothetical protein ACRD8U_12960 [Pyrinomonadaceae bacterium]